jgi:hypothetical protein
LVPENSSTSGELKKNNNKKTNNRNRVREVLVTKNVLYIFGSLVALQTREEASPWTLLF